MCGLTGPARSRAWPRSRGTRTPAPIVAKLYAEVQKALADPQVKERIATGAGVPSKMPLADIEPFAKAEIAKWADVVKRAGIKVR